MNHFFKPIKKRIFLRKEKENTYVGLNPYAKILIFNEVTKQVLDRCDGTKTVSQIILELAELYIVSKERIEEDIEFIMEQLMKVEFIEQSL